MERREFIGLSSLATLGGFPGRLLPDSARALELVIGRARSTDARVVASDEEFWIKVRKFYVTAPDLIDLDNANTAPTPAPVFDAYVRRGQRLRQAPAESFGKMWGDADKTSRRDLAKYLGAEPKHMALMPNATVALNTVLHGFPLRQGDEILVTNHEYPDMIETILQRAKREGIIMRKVDIPSPDQDQLALVDAVKSAITPRTKLMLISQVSAWSGEVLPVREVSAAARERGVAVVVDAAQSVGLLDVNFTEIGCDFFATSLHKWLAAPMGTGALIMRPEHVGKVWPLHPPSWDTAKYPMDIYEWTGTFNVAAYASIVDALNFQRTLGVARKRERVRFLGDYWQSRLADIPGARILTPRDTRRSLGVAAISVTGAPSAKLVTHLRSSGILVQDKSGRHSPFKDAVRVSPGVYATTNELDRFVRAVKEAARKGV